ncbi:hypothetical protein P8452_57453 [Trifolium repens]|nr:hypothetical protein P8452_57453 [Trifolium repens]
MIEEDDENANEEHGEDSEQGRNEEHVDELVDTAAEETIEVSKTQKVRAAEIVQEANTEKERRSKKRNERPPASEDDKPVKSAKRSKSLAKKPSKKAASKGNVSESNVNSKFIETLKVLTFAELHRLLQIHFPKEKASNSSCGTPLFPCLEMETRKTDMSQPDTPTARGYSKCLHSLYLLWFCVCHCLPGSQQTNFQEASYSGASYPNLALNFFKRRYLYDYLKKRGLFYTAEMFTRETQVTTQPPLGICALLRLVIDQVPLQKILTLGHVADDVPVEVFVSELDDIDLQDTFMKPLGKIMLHHYCHLLQHTHFISISCICVHLHLLQHSSLKTRRSIKALSCHLKLSSLKTRKEQKDGGYKFRMQ